MHKGLMIYKMDSNKYVPDQQDKVMNKAYDYFIQKLRDAEPTISAQYPGDIEFIENIKHNNVVNQKLKPIYWETLDGVAEIELVNTNMEKLYMPDIDTDIDPHIRAIWFGSYPETSNLMHFCDQLREYLPADFPIEKYAGAYSMLEF
mgnify:CR=1 FL=1